MERTASDSSPPAPPLTAACGRPLFFPRPPDPQGQDEAVLGHVERQPDWGNRCAAPIRPASQVPNDKLRQDRNVCLPADWNQARARLNPA